jgi:hypothetical protein
MSTSSSATIDKEPVRGREDRPADAEVIDTIFSQGFVAWGAAAAPLIIHPHGSGADGKSPADQAGVPLVAGARFQADHLEKERQRLEAYTRQQFEMMRQQQAMLDQQRQELLRRQNEVTESTALRQQQLHHQLQLASAQQWILENREKSLKDDESQFVLEQHKLARMHKDLQASRAEIAEQQELLEELQAETTRLIREEAEKRKQLAAIEATLRERWEAWQEQSRQYAEQRQEIEQRYRALEEAEAAVARREAEVDELRRGVLRELGERQGERV